MPVLDGALFLSTARKEAEGRIVPCSVVCEGRLSVDVAVLYSPGPMLLSVVNGRKRGAAFVKKEDGCFLRKIVTRESSCVYDPGPTAAGVFVSGVPVGLNREEREPKAEMVRLAGLYRGTDGSYCPGPSGIVSVRAKRSAVELKLWAAGGGM